MQYRTCMLECVIHWKQAGPLRWMTKIAEQNVLSWTQNVPFTPNGELTDWWAPPAEGQKPGDYVIMRAEMNCVCVMSACPSDDICGINGPEGTKSVHFEILESE